MLRLYMLLISTITYMLIPALYPSIILSCGWHYIYWYFTYKYINVYEHINISRLLYVLPALFYGIVNFMILDNESYITTMIHVVNFCINMFMGIYLINSYLKIRYDYLLKNGGPYEVVCRFSDNMYIGDALESFGFFEFFSRARIVTMKNQSGSQYQMHCKSFDPDEIFNGKRFIGMTYELYTSPSYELLGDFERKYFYTWNIRSELIPSDKFIIIDNYNVYGPLYIVHIEGSGNREYTLLFKAGSHYDNFMTSLTQIK